MAVQRQRVDRFKSRSDRGFAMVALLVTLAVMTVLMTVALPVLTTMAQREREEELVFRGKQYARAIALFQRKYANATPPNIDVLLNEKFLRKKYKDPITNDDFNILGPGSPELAAALNSAPQAGQQLGQATQGRQGQPGQQGQQGGLGRGGLQQPTQSGFGLNTNNQGGNAPGGVMAVASKSTKTSLRLYEGHDKYNEWVFMPTQASLAAGRGGRGGRAGGAGGEAGRGRGPQPQDGRGRGQTSPFGGPSPFGGNRGGQSQPFGGGGMPPAGQPRGPGRF
jgi:type II secretory pathway pseudopilin PulG